MMSEELSYDEVLDKLPAYALGALEPEEMLAVDAYFRKHEDLLTRLERSEQAAAQLAHLAPNTPLPAKNRRALMARVQADLAAQAAPQPEPDPEPDQRSAASPLKPSEASARPANFWEAISPARGWAIATGLAGLALIVVILYAGQMQGRLREAEADSARLRTANEQLQQNYEILEQQLQTEQGRLAFIANTTPGRTIAMPGTEAAPQASGQLFVGDNNLALLGLHDLTPLPAQQIYQLWLIPADEAPVPAGLLTIEPEGPTWLTVELPAEAQGFAAVGVSIEPAGGSPAPTGPIVLLGPTG